MREIASRCPRCGRVRHLPVDNWADLLDAALDMVCPDGCAPERIRKQVDRAGIGPWLLLAVLIVAPAIAVVEALAA